MQSVKANVVRTMRAMASAFRTRSVRALFLPDAECQGKCCPDDTRNGICLPDEESQGIIPSRRRVSRQMSSEQCTQWHLPSERGVSGHYSFQTPSVKGNVIRTTQATTSAFRTRSVRALFLPDTECHGKCPLDDACHGICLPDKECLSILPSGR